MATLVQKSDDVLEYRPPGRGLALVAIAMGAGMLFLCVNAAGSPLAWNPWTWCIALFGVLLVTLGCVLGSRGPHVWRFERRTRSVTAPPRRREQPIATFDDIAGVVLTSPKLGPSLLLLALSSGATETLEAGGSFERGGMRVDGEQLAGFLGVPFQDQTHE